MSQISESETYMCVCDLTTCRCSIFVLSPLYEPQMASGGQRSKQRENCVFRCVDISVDMN